jgi:hypothetical protein
VLPQAPKVTRSREKTAEPMCLTVFPGPPSTYQLYDDDGSSVAYQSTGGQWTAIDTCFVDNAAVITIHPPSSNWGGELFVLSAPCLILPASLL